MEEKTTVTMIERVAVAKFDHTLEDTPTEPVDTVIQETRTEVSLVEAFSLGWQPKDGSTSIEPTVEATGTVQIGTSDAGGPSVGD